MLCPTELQCAIYADGELPAREARELTSHLESCGACRQLVQSLRAESRVLVECFQSTEFIEFELEDEVLGAPQAKRLGVARFAAFILAMSVLLRPVLNVLEEAGMRGLVNGIVITVAYLIPAAIGFVEAVVRNASWIALTAILLLGILLFSRRSILTSSILSMLALLTVFSSPGYGLDVRRADKPVTVPPGETVDDTLVVFGDSVTIDGTITGNLIAFVRRAVIRGQVKGNVISFAQRIELEGSVDGSVIGFAQSVQTRGQIAHDIYAFGQNVTIASGGRIDGNAMMFGAESMIEGTVGKDVLTAAASVFVPAPARIGGALTARVSSPENVHISGAAVIEGPRDIQAPRPRPSSYSTLSFYVWQMIWLMAAFVTGTALFWSIPALLRPGLETSRELLLSAGMGLVVLIGAPIVSLVAAITLIGLPLGLIGFILWIIAVYLAKILVAAFVGRSLLEKYGDTHPAIPVVLLAGLLPIFIAINLPYIGTLINFFLIVLGLGMLAVRIYHTPRWRQAQAEA